MTNEPALQSEELVEFLRDAVGDHLRSVLYYDDDGGDLLYMRDDVADDYSHREREDVLRDMRLEAIERVHQEDLYVHGSLNCTVRCFDDAVEMHFAHGDTSGTAVALDSEVFAVHNTFIGQCLDLMESD